MRLRQIALVARDLEPVVRDLTSVLGLGEAFADPGVGEFGLHNAVFPIGDTFLEVVSPTKEETTAGRLLERRGGDGGYMVIFQTDDLERARKHVDQLGIRVVWEVSLPDAATLHLHPRDVGAAIVSLDAMDPAPSWRWAGPGWEERSRTDVVKRITGVELQSENPAALAERWSELLEQPAEWEGNTSYTITLPEDGAQIRFRPASDGRGEGVAAVMLEAADAAAAEKAAEERGLPVDAREITLCGTRFLLR
jgi:hypothetical protein